MKFNSQICTTKEQSERLLKLGLKPETADCMWCAVTKDAKGKEIPSKNIIWYLQAHTRTSQQIVGFMEYTHIPAWSLHRLIEIAEVSVEVSGLFVRISSTYYYEEKDNVYDNLIDAISELINNEVFNKEYLSYESKN